MEQIMQYIDIQTLKVGLALMIFMAVNIVLGSRNAIVENTFDRKILFQGIIKSLIVVACLLLIYIAGLLTEDIAVININGDEVNVLIAIYLLILSAFAHYVYEVWLKLKDILKSKIEISDGM